MLANTIGRLVQKTIRARASMQSLMGWNAKGDRSEKKEPRASGAQVWEETSQRETVAK
jgi:hypothetical protein